MRVAPSLTVFGELAVRAGGALAELRAPDVVDQRGPFAPLFAHLRVGSDAELDEEVLDAAEEATLVEEAVVHELQEPLHADWGPLRLQLDRDVALGSAALDDRDLIRKCRAVGQRANASGEAPLHHHHLTITIAHTSHVQRPVT